MDYNKFNDKYKNILEIFEKIEKPIVSEPFDDKNIKEGFRSERSNKMSDELLVGIVLIIVLTILAIVLFSFSNDITIEKYKNRIVYSFILLIPLLSLLTYFFTKGSSDDIKKENDPFIKSLISNDMREIFSLIGYSIVSIILIGVYAYSNKDVRIYNTLLLFFIIVGIPLIGTITYFYMEKPSGEAPLAKTTLYMAFLFLGGFLFLILPEIIAAFAIGKSANDLDMSSLLIGLTVLGLVVLTLNMYYGLFNIEKGKSDLYISLLGIFFGFLVFSKMMSSDNNKGFGIFWWLISLFVLVIAILHNEFSLLGNSFDKKNLQVFVGFILAIILLLFILNTINIKIPLIARGLIVAGIIMFMTFVNNEIVSVYDANNDTTLYTFAGIFALIMVYNHQEKYSKQIQFRIQKYI